MKGIIMSGDHPTKILDLIKTMTRRTYGLEWVNRLPDAWKFLRMEGDKGVFKLIGNDLPSIYAQLASIPRGSYPLIKGESPNLEFHIRCPYGGVGDRLWVRETYNIQAGDFPLYKADCSTEFAKEFRWYPSLFMPRWASRITLEITELRAERLQEITPKDIASEGVVPIKDYFAPRMFIRDWHTAFARLWDSLNAKRGYGWDTNPWVWPITFKVVK